jgi:hypothetical protein
MDVIVGNQGRKRAARHVTIVPVVLVSVVVAAAVVLGVPVNRSNTAGASVAWPRHVTSQLLTTPEGIENPLARGAVVTPALRRTACSKLISASYIGDIGWGLWCLDQFEYPVFSVDQGATWRVGGRYFQGPWADAAAMATVMTTVSASVAVAWTPDTSTLYVTPDAGSHWYAQWHLGDVESVVSSTTRGRVDLIEVMVGSSGFARRGNALYWSTDQGRHWFLKNQMG